MYPYNIKKSEENKPKNISMSAYDKTLTDMLQDAIDDEYVDYLKYTALSEIAADSEDAETLKSIAYDEFKHKRIFEEIYYSVVNAPAIQPRNYGEFVPTDLTIDLKEGLFDELEGVEMYRDILSAFDDLPTRDKIFEIITDEQAHADLLNYLISKKAKIKEV